MAMLQGQVAFITGGARGQGRAHALTRAREGANVVLIDLADDLDTVPYPMATEEDLAETVRQVKALGADVLAIKADVRVQSDLDDAVERAVSRFGRIDMLMCNAGIWSKAPFWQITEAQWDEMIGINLTGVWKSVKAVTPLMIAQESGSIVITASTNALEPGPSYAHYVSAKHGVLGLMKNIAFELAPYGIRCNAIAPGAIRTPMADNQVMWDMHAGGSGGTPDHMIESGYHYHALKGSGMLSPQVIADTALYLNSSLGAAVTGVTIPVDAGHSILSKYNHSPVR
jgi:SDR family mycofactocin-dependent oxidoreductase